MPPEASAAIEPREAVGAGRRLLSGRLDLAFAVDGNGRTYLARQYADYPFHVCRALYQDQDLKGLATLYIQSCSGGVYEHDRLDMTLATEACAEAHVSTQSATVVHSMPSGHARLSARLHCVDRSYLEYLPDPQILFPGSRCYSRIVVRLGGDAVALVADSFLGHDPDGQGGTFSSYESEIVIENETGETLAIDRLRIDGEAFHSACPGISGRYTAQGTMIVASLVLAAHPVATSLREAACDFGEAIIGASELPKGAGLTVRVLASDGAALKRAMYNVWYAARLALKGGSPVMRRK